MSRQTLDNGQTVEVEYRVVSYGSRDSWFEPGDPAEVEIEEVYDDDGIEVQLTDQEYERISAELAAIAYDEGPEPFEDDVF